MAQVFRRNGMNCLHELHSELVVAHHEAAHCLVAHLLGADVRGIILEATCHEGAPPSWRGRTAGVECSSLDGVSKAKIAVAGSLAEIRVCAVRHGQAEGKLNTDSVASLVLSSESVLSITRALLAAGSEKTPTHGELCADTAVTTDPNSAAIAYKHTHFLGESRTDMLCAARALRETGSGGLSEEALVPVVEETGQLLERSEVSRAVAEIAKRLMQTQTETVLRKELRTKWFTGLLPRGTRCGK